MNALRTPDERFENLPGYEFEAKYLNVPDGEGGTRTRPVALRPQVASHPAQVKCRRSKWIRVPWQVQVHVDVRGATHRAGHPLGRGRRRVRRRLAQEGRNALAGVLHGAILA